MIKIAICDDMEIFVEELRELVSSYQWQDEYEISTFLTAKELMQSVKEGNNYNILIMDIEFKDEDTKGTDVASEIKKINPATLIIYISSYDNFYMDMVQAEPFRFLKKPIDKEKLHRALSDAYKRIKIYSYSYSFNGETHIVDLQDIMYFCSEHKKIHIKDRKSEEQQFYGKLDDVEREIESICNFYLRVNKSYLVNRHYVTKLSPNDVKIGEESFTVTRKYKGKYLEKVFEER